MLRRKTTLALAVSVGLLGLVCASAEALISTHGEGLVNWMGVRSGDLTTATRTERKQAQAITKASIALGRESESLTGDAKATYKAVKKLDRWFDAEANYSAVADGTLDAFAADAAARGASLEGVAPLFTSSRVAGQVDRSATNAAALLDKAAASTKRVKRAKLIWKAFKKLGGADRKAQKAALDGNDRFLFLGGQNNSPLRGFLPERQVDAQTLAVAPGGSARTEWETGAVPDAVGNWLLVANWSDENADGQVDQVRLSYFSRIGMDDPVLAWYVDTTQRGLAALGISLDETPTGTRVTFEGTELPPTVGASNSAEGTLRLDGRLLVQTD